MVDLLKTSMMVTVTVIPSHTDGSARRGCTQNNCLFSVGGEGDYENLASPDNGKVNRKTAALQTAVPGSHRRRLDMFVSMLYCSKNKLILIIIYHFHLLNKINVVLLIHLPASPPPHYLRTNINKKMSFSILEGGGTEKS